MSIIFSFLWESIFAGYKMSQFQNYQKASHRRKPESRKEPKTLDSAAVAPGGLENSTVCQAFAGMTTTDF
ncbi:MAG: hypothetical protein C0403_14790 [Desulfobacterium sp.]|nr:hypothetical protein [Desulfobacterium sp.]